MADLVSQSPYPENLVHLDGSWEQSGRSVNTAALLGLLGIGVLYFNGQSFLAVAAIGITKLTQGDAGRSFEDLLSSFRQFVGPLRVVVFATQFLLMLAPTLFLVKRWHSSNVKAYVRLSGGSFADILLAILITMAFLPAGNYVAEEFVRQLGIPEKLMEINTEIFTSRSPMELLWLVIVVCLTPALCEELFFRGYVQRTFERTMDWRSVVLVGVIFGLFHFNPLGLLTLSVLGMLLGYFFYRSRSIFPSMAAHFTNNLIAVGVLYRPSDETALFPAGSIPLWLVGITLPIGIGLLFLYHSRTAFRFGADPLHEPRA
ncbi:MAG TPA: CPBP family intramembrane glutamic endopeptidase [Bacteroidota bacterium]|nr:CPBP family intramembrane glutamic endopeptidase [Bacteroidota bacterium]